jgi:hypothetical protein
VQCRNQPSLGHAAQGAPYFHHALKEITMQDNTKNTANTPPAKPAPAPAKPADPHAGHDMSKMKKAETAPKGGDKK